MDASLSKQDYYKDVLNRLGQGFLLGTAAGSILYFFQGMFYAPRRQRFYHGICHVRDRAPLLGGSIALWSGCFALSGGFLRRMRNVDDEWNDTIGGALTAFVMYVRSHGVRVAMGQAMQIGILFLLFEGLAFKGKRR